jgi:hypothetical protein
MAMQKFKVLERSFINNSMREPGEIVEFDTDVMTPSANVELVDDTPARKGAKPAVVKEDF